MFNMQNKILTSLLAKANLELCKKTFCSSSVLKNVGVSVTPGEALLDNAPQIKVEGLSKNQKVTLWNNFIDDSGLEFCSYAHYTSDQNGVVDVENQVSEGGKYSGFFPEGLVASMHTSPNVYKDKPKLKWARLFKKDVTKPMKYNLKVVDGHLSLKELYGSDTPPESLGSTSFIRHLMSEGVTRTEIEHNNIRGILFLPPGDGPFPTILDLFGAESGAKEFRSAMLASYGYASLVLPYYNYKDLPMLTTRIDLDYFLEAIEYLKSHPKVHTGGIGLFGSSKGGEVGLTICSLTDQIKACVSINAYHKSIDMGYYLKGKLFKEPIIGSPSTAHVYLNEKGQLMAYGLDDFYHWDYKDILPVDQIPDDCHILIAASDQDGGHGHRSAITLKERARRFKRDTVSTIVYPEAGHLLDPPFHSHISAVWNSIIQIRKPDGTKFQGMPHYYGGTPLGACLASKDLWKRSLSLFHKRLVLDKGLPVNTCKHKPPY